MTRKYKLRQINGETYLFYSWNDSYYYVLKKTSGKSETGSSFPFRYNELFKEAGKQESSALDGTWTSVDFYHFFAEDPDPVNYDPENNKWKDGLYITKIEIKGASARFTSENDNGKKNITVHDFSEEHKYKNSIGSIPLHSVNGECYLYKIKGETYLLYEWQSNHWEHGYYVLKKTSDTTDFLSNLREVTNKTIYNGTWEAIKFRQGYDISKAYSLEPESGYNSVIFKKVVIKNDKATLTLYDETEEILSMDKNRIGADKYRVCSINGKLYLFYEYVTNYGVEGLCVFRKK